ncbi:E3 ubiquitin/ISG15 ligase TRIM25-like [Mixophyes fleayi]|uniref:E3 ubiquitin/ISG15 ligase TRIM25-like n=1 Tax=Mixophyes fleayi TaxID=3061075 RepID=UPI003F4D8E62
MASADLRQELDCSICLNIYTDPVILKCGHNFCRVCIDRVLDTQEGSGVYSCPECRAEFQDRSVLEKNRKLCNIAEHVRSIPEEETEIFCTYCVLSPVPALKTCLRCEASFCDIHLRTHNKSAEHVLINPTISLEKRNCSVHKKILEYYCTEDAVCICVSCCLIGEHRGHQMESMDEASEKKKEKLRNVLQKLTTKREETEKRVQSLQERRRDNQEKAVGVTEKLTALFRDIRRQLDDLEKRVLSEISGQKESISLSVSDLIHQLELKKDELFRKMHHIEELCNMSDPVTVLHDPDIGDLCDTEELSNMTDHVTVTQEQESHRDNSCNLSEEGDTEEGDTEEGDTEEGDTEEEDTEEGDSEWEDTEEEDTEEGDTEEEDTEEGDTEEGDTEEEDTEEGARYENQVNDVECLDMGLISETLHTGLSDIITSINVWVYAQEPTDILLDVNTAGNNIHISGDQKTASWSDIEQDRPETSERFLDNSQVISTRIFSSGRHYWEVEIRESELWSVGMCYPSIDRTGHQSHIGCNNQSWCLAREDDEYLLIHDSEEIQLSSNIPYDTVRVYLDYEAGQLSFYSLCDPIRHLHTVTATFTEPLHAILGVWEGSIQISGENQELGEILPETGDITGRGI